jgi:hypothetical protein
MPLGVMPTFFDFSEAGVIPYAAGGYSLDVNWSDMLSSPKTHDTSATVRRGKERVVDLWRG